jgi:hypothetical protein
MKKLIALLILGASLLVAAGCQKQEAADMTPGKGAEVAAPGQVGVGGGGQAAEAKPSPE